MKSPTSCLLCTFTLCLPLLFVAAARVAVAGTSSASQDLAPCHSGGAIAPADANKAGRDVSRHRTQGALPVVDLKNGEPGECAEGLAFSDDFSAAGLDSAKWPIYFNWYGGQFQVTDGRLAYTVTGIPVPPDHNPEAFVASRRVASRTNSFSTIVEVSGTFMLFEIISSQDWRDQVRFNLGKQVPGGFYASAVLVSNGLNVAGKQLGVPIPSAHGRFRADFDPHRGVIMAYFSPSIAGDSDWMLLESFGIAGSNGSSGNTEWGLTEVDGFALGLRGLLPGSGRFFDNVSVMIAYDSPEQMILKLMEDIIRSGLPDRNLRPLISSLEAAVNSCGRRNPAAVSQLEAFQHKVMAQVAKKYPALAEAWIDAAQAIIEKLNPSEYSGPKGKILFVQTGFNDAQVALFDTATGQKTSLPGTSMENISTPTWSPDGEWFTFSGGTGLRSEIYKIRADGSALTALTMGGNNFVDPDWCPCGSKIAFQRAEGRSYWVNTDGSTLTGLPVTLGFIRWSPDGAKLLGSNWGTESYDSTLSLYDLATGQRTIITPHQPGWAYQRSAWSPDGGRLAVGKLNRTSNRIDVVVLNSDGSGEVNLTAGMPDCSASNPTWSPDGQWILFMSNAAGNWDIWAMQPDGTHKLNLTQSPEDEVGPPDFFPTP